MGFKFNKHKNYPDQSSYINPDQSYIKQNMILKNNASNFNSYNLYGNRNGDSVSNPEFYSWMHSSIKSVETSTRDISHKKVHFL